MMSTYHFFRRTPKTNRRQKGDTIIEVLVALSIMSGVIGISYASAARSSNIGQQSQERAEALQLAQSQIELLRTHAGSFGVDGYNIFDTTAGRSFCMTTTTPPIVSQGLPPDSLVDEILDSTSPTRKYDPDCISGPDNRYHISVTYIPDLGTLGPPETKDNDKGTFTIRVRWDTIGGSKEKDEVKLVYRLHKVQFGP